LLIIFFVQRVFRLLLQPAYLPSRIFKKSRQGVYGMPRAR
jgi:hypothetical protein